MIKKLLIASLLIAQIFCIYENQVGNIDWKIKTFGKIQECKITGDQIFYLNNKNQFGSISVSDGQITESEQIDNKQVIWNKNQKGNLIISDQSTLIVHTLLNKAYTNLPEIKLESQAIDFIEQEGSIWLLTKNSLTVASNSKTYQMASSLDQEEFLKINKDLNGNIYIVSYSAQNQSICVVTQFDETAKTANRKCAQLGQKEFQYQNLLIGNTFIFYHLGQEQISFSLELKQWQNQKIENAVSFQVQEQDNFLIVQQKSGYQIFIFQNNKLELFSQISTQDNLNFLKHQDKKVIYYAIQQKHTVEVHKIDENKQNTKLASYFSDTENPIQQGWIRFLNQKFTLLVQRKNLHTEFFNQKLNKIEWKSHQSVQNTQQINFIDFGKIQQAQSAYYNTLKKYGAFNPLTLILALQQRVTEEIFDQVDLIQQNFVKTIDLAFKLTQVRDLSEVSALNRGLGSQDDDILYKIRKIMLIVTQQKILISYDTKFGSIIWENEILSNLLDDSYIFEGVYELNGQKNLFLVYHSHIHKSTQIFEVDSNTGKLQLIKVFNDFGESLTVIEIKKDFNYLVFVNNNFQAKVFPEEFNEQFKSQTIIFYKEDLQNRRLVGYSNILGSQKFEEIWTFLIPQNEEIINVDSPFKHYSFSASPKIAIFDDVRVIYKHIDFLNLAIVTKRINEKNKGVLNLYILNSKTGRILYNSFQSLIEFNLPINLVYDENSVIVTYFSQSQSIYEAWVVELYSNKIENSFLTMLEKYYLTNTVYDYYDYIDHELSIVFMEQKYGLPVGVKALDVVQSKLSLTKRNLVAITPENQVYQLDRILLSSRRAVKDREDYVKDKKKQALESLELPPYSYLLPISHTNVLSYYVSLSGINKIKFAHTDLESTQLFAAYGGDLFVSKITPDKTYDMLSEGFNYIQLVSTIILVLIVVFVMRKFYLKSKIFKLFHN